MKNVISLLVFLSFLSQAWANNNCAQSPINEKNTKQVDLRSEFGEVRDQDSTGLCYAFAAADLLSHYFYKHAKEVPWSLRTNNFAQKGNSLSPIGMASVLNSAVNPRYYDDIKTMNSQQLAEYNKKKTEEAKKQNKTWNGKGIYPYGGGMSACINKALENGFCLEKDVPSESFSSVLSKICSEKKICASNLQELLTLIYDNADLNGDSTKQKNYCDLLAILKSSYPGLPETEIQKILKVTSRDKIFYQLAFAACDNQFAYSVPGKGRIQAKEIIKNPDTNSDLLAKIDSVLDSGNAVGVLYSGHFLQHGNAKPEGLDHASTLVGKSFDPDTCEVKYILRNTWGPNCGLYRVTPAAYYGCTQSSDFYKPHYFDTVVSDLKKQKNQLIEKKSQNVKMKQDVSKINEEIEQIDSQIKFYANSQNQTYAKLQKYCSTKFPAKAVEPKVTCDDKSGYLYVSKSLLKKFLYGISYIE